MVECMYVVSPNPVHAGNTPLSFSVAKPFSLHDALDAHGQRGKEKHVNHTWTTGQNVIPPPADDDSLALFSDVLDNRLGHAHELGVSQPQGRRNFIGRLESAHAKQSNHALDEGIDPLVLGIDILFRHLVLRGDLTHDFFFPHAPVQSAAEIAGDPAAAAPILVRERKHRLGRRVHTRLQETGKAHDRALRLGWAHSRREELFESTLAAHEKKEGSAALASYRCDRNTNTRPTATLSMMICPEAPMAKSGILSSFTSPGEAME